MPVEHLRVAAFCVYLGAWLVLGAAAIAGAIPRRRRPSAPVLLTAPVLLGAVLQGASALPITLSLPEGPLRPRMFELAGVIALAPLASALFVWALASARRAGTARILVTRGAYAWVRHPIYLAFLAMLLATGLLASAGLKLAAVTALYVAGTELRIAAEEAELEENFPGEYARYRRTVRWRYLPGLR